MLQYRCALKALESRLEILNEEFSLQHDPQSDRKYEKPLEVAVQHYE